MKSKKQKNNNNGSQATKKQSKMYDPIAPLGKQFQLLYRTCDRLPTSQQYQSVLFLKRKKISNEDHSASQQKKSKKKKQTIKKKKIEEKPFIDQVQETFLKKNQSLSMTKSTMPSTTFGLLKKSSFADTFKQKFDIQKSSLRKINNLNSSNSSRYLSSKYLQKQQKNPKKKLPTSPSKANLKSPTKSISQTQLQNSSKSINNQRNSQKLQSIKSKRTIVSKDVCKEDNNNKQQYVFLDGEYFHVDNPSLVSEALSEKVASGHKISSEKYCSNEFIQGFSKFKINIERKLSQVNEKSQRKQSSQRAQSSSSLSSQERRESEQEVLSKIIFIQRWWRAFLEKRAIEQCNNIKHFPSNASSEEEIQGQYTTPQTVSQESEQKMMKNFIMMQEKLILNHMHSQKQILDRMLELNKIDTFKYNVSLSEVQTNFQRQMLEINKLKKKIELEAEKMEQLKIKIKQKSQIMSQLQKIPAEVILEHFFETNQSQCHEIQQLPQQQVFASRQKSTGCHYSELNDEKNTQSVKQANYRKNLTTDQISQNSQKTLNSPLDVHNEEVSGHKQKFDEEEDQNSEESENQEINSEETQKMNHIFTICADRQFAQSEIQKRFAHQLGMGFQSSGNSNSSISTSVISVHNFLMNFLKFYEYFYKDEFLKLVNLPYGYNQFSRLKLAQSYTQQSWKKSEAEDQQQFFRIQAIIGDQILQDFQEHHYQLPEDVDNATKAGIYFQKIHQKAIIDCFNESLNCFRPYYFINGPPYLWNYSEKALTFYYIAEENIQEVFQKTQYKVLKNASCLCGTIVQSLISKPQITQGMCLEQKFGKYRESVNGVLTENRQEKLGKVEKQEIEQFNFKWEAFDEEKTAIMIAVSSLICDQLMLELLEIKPLGNTVECFNASSSKQNEQEQNQTKSSHQSISSASHEITSDQIVPSQGACESNQDCSSDSRQQQQQYNQNPTEMNQMPESLESDAKQALGQQQEEQQKQEEQEQEEQDQNSQNNDEEQQEQEQEQEQENECGNAQQQQQGNEDGQVEQPEQA